MKFPLVAAYTLSFASIEYKSRHYKKFPEISVNLYRNKSTSDKLKFGPKFDDIYVEGIKEYQTEYLRGGDLDDDLRC